MRRSGLLLLVLVTLGSGCGLTGPSFPSDRAWNEANPPLIEGGISLYLIVDFTVGRGFPGATATLSIDGEVVLEGTGQNRPSEHCNWYGPYELIIEPGEHSVEFTVNELSLTETFELTEASTGIAGYRDPSYDEDIGSARVEWWLAEGVVRCE